MSATSHVFESHRVHARAVRMLALVKETLDQIPDTAREPELRKTIRHARRLAEMVLEMEREGR